MSDSDRNCDRDVKPAVSSTKTTVLEGYYATGDQECFCFDECEGPWTHRQKIEADPRYAAWADGEDDAFDIDHCRVYPTDLIPEGSHGMQGTWEITVTFTPTEDSNV